MFRHSLVLALGLAFAGSASAATWADALFEEHSKDFGAVPRGPMLTHPFHVTNNTGQPVTISGARVSCGCTSTVILKNRLAPGESTSVVANMDTGRFSGSKTVTIFVSIVEPQFDEVRLWVTANSRDDLYVTPDALAFGKVKSGKEVSSAITLSFLGDAQAQIAGAACESHYVEPSVKEVRRTPTEVAYQVQAKIRPDTPPGRWYTEVWLQTSNPSMPRIRVPVTIEVEPTAKAEAPKEKPADTTRDAAKKEQ